MTGEDPSGGWPWRAIATLVITAVFIAADVMLLLQPFMSRQGWNAGGVALISVFSLAMIYTWGRDFMHAGKNVVNWMQASRDHGKEDLQASGAPRSGCIYPGTGKAAGY